MAKGRPRNRAAVSASPRSSSPRMWVELTVTPSRVTGGMMSQPRPSSSARRESRAASPAFLCPKRKSWPATSHRASQRRTSHVTKSCQGMVIISRSKGATITSAPGHSPSAAACRSAAVVSRGTGTPVTYSRGERSKVKRAGVRPRSEARRAARSSSAWWPRCSPSKNPSAMARSMAQSPSRSERTANPAGGEACPTLIYPQSAAVYQPSRKSVPCQEIVARRV